MPPHTRSAAGLIPNDDYIGDPLDEDHLPNSVFAIMNARPEPQMEEPRRLPGVPEIAYTLPQELYLKAQNQQNQLTDAERQLLLSRGDLIGKALAQPSSLTEVERYWVLDRPPPDVVRARIELASNGELSTVAELVVKATPDASGLNNTELYLMANNFHEAALEVRFMQGDCHDMPSIPGATEARRVFSFCEELGLVEEEKTIVAASVKQFLRDRERKRAPHLAAIAAKEAHANTPEALQRKEKERALKKEEQDGIKENHVIVREINELILKVELESELGDFEKDELRRQLKEKRAQNHTIHLKLRGIRDRLYALGPPNPHKELADNFALKQQTIVGRLVELGKQLEGLQGQGNGSEEDEVKSKIEDIYAEWAVITQNHNVARQCLYGKTASDVRLFREDEVQQEQIGLEQKVIIARISELRKIQREIGEDDPGKNELKQQIEDRSVQYRTLVKKSRELKALRLCSLGITIPPPEPRQQDTSEVLYIEE